MYRTACLTLIALLTGCASADSQPATTATTTITAQEPPAAMQTITLGIGEKATLADGSRLTYLSLVNDSRCPPNVQCIWAGDAEISLRWEPAASGKPKTFSLHTNPIRDHGQTGLDVGKVHIALQALERGIAPEATLSITPVDKA